VSSFALACLAVKRSSIHATPLARESFSAATAAARALQLRCRDAPRPARPISFFFPTHHPEQKINIEASITGGGPGCALSTARVGYHSRDLPRLLSCAVRILSRFSRSGLRSNGGGMAPSIWLRTSLTHSLLERGLRPHFVSLEREW